MQQEFINNFAEIADVGQRMRLQSANQSGKAGYPSL